MEQLRQANLGGCSVTAVAQRGVRQTQNPGLLDQLKADNEEKDGNYLE